MSIYIGILLLIINFFMGIKKLQWGLLCYIVLIFVCPTIGLGTIKVSYDLLGFAVLLFLVLFHSKEIVNKKVNIYMSVLCMILSFATLTSVMFFGGTISIISFFGQIRCVILLMILASYCETGTIKKAIYMVVPINSFIMICQYVSSTSHIWSYQIWGKESTGALKVFYELGRMERLTGSFNNVFPAGYFMLFACIVALDNYCVCHYRKDFCILVLSLGCGLMTTGKTFMMGVPLAFIMWFAAAHWWGKKDYYLVKRRNIIVIFCLLFGFLTVIFLSNYLKFGGQFRYYASTILNGTFLQERFGKNGVANEALSVFKQHFLIGVGSTFVGEEFLGDSQYVLLLHNTGMIGGTIVLIYFLKQLAIAYQKEDVAIVVLMMLSIFMGVAGITIFDNAGILLMSFVELRNSYQKKTSGKIKLFYEEKDINCKCPEVM